METEDPLWEQVEIELAMWCVSKAGPCTCPKGAELRQWPSEALTALLRDLNSQTYHGHWKKYLKP